MVQQNLMRKLVKNNKKSDQATSHYNDDLN